MKSSTRQSCGVLRIVSKLLVVSGIILSVGASNNNQIDYSIYGMSMQRDWLYDSKTISIKNFGCVWGYVDTDNAENMGCMANDSGDGTTSWYQMANCRRAQVAYGMYASSGTTSCNKKDLKESFVTTNGVAEFAYLLGSYGYNSPISSDDTGSFPVCESDGNGYYLAVGCSSSGGFTIDRFTDQYCLEYYDTYDSLNNFNSAMKKLKCYNCYNSKQGTDVSYSVASYLLEESSTCSSTESSLCTGASYSSGSRFQRSGAYGSGASASFSNKVKYTLGSAMLLGSVCMFVGILFTNRRKRHAMMHRKLRHSSDKKKKKKRSSSSSKKSSKSGRSRAGSGVFA